GAGWRPRGVGERAAENRATDFRRSWQYSRPAAVAGPGDLAMPPAAPARLLARLRSTYELTGEADARLLTRFVRGRDAAAFAELVRRHGPMVLAVCRRTAGDSHLAEDAFPAAFRVLARRAADVRPRAAAAPFLSGAARRTALRARTMAARRRARETPVPTPPDPPAADPCPATAEALRALD